LTLAKVRLRTLDFEVTSKGDVSPSAVDKKKKELGKCTKVNVTITIRIVTILIYAPQNDFTLDLGRVVLDHQPK